MAPWLFHRISGIVLIPLMVFKLYTGLAITRDLPGAGCDMKALHCGTPTVDKLLLFFLVFHVLYGVRLVLIDLGIKWDRLLFWLATILGVVIFGGSYWYLFTG
ncbi:MAG: hypothetical protein GXP25_07160 [Planctomycetes bacterium]|nr:hypothetical protein [Planctomycetota bacterium]